MNDEQKRLLKLAGLKESTVVVEAPAAPNASGAVRRVKNELTTVLANALRMGLSTKDISLIVKVALDDAMDIGRVDQVQDERDNAGAVDGVREGQGSIPLKKPLSPEEQKKADKKKADDEWRSRYGLNSTDNRGSD